MGERERPDVASREDACRRLPDTGARVRARLAGRARAPRLPVRSWPAPTFLACLRQDVRKKSLNKLKDSIREKTRRTRGQSLDVVIVDLNRTLRGWFNYFKQAHRFTFDTVDGFVRRRLRALLRKQDKRPGRGHSQADHQRWTNAFFANAGLFALHTAWQTARQSR